MDFFHCHWKGIGFFILGIIFAFLLSRNPLFQSVLLHLGAFGYIGAFIAGILFVSTFTVATAVLMLIALAQYMSPIEISILAGIGATVGNYFIFLFMNRKITHHIHTFFNKRKKNHKTHYVSPYMHWFLPFLAVLIIASPFPDEIGVFLLSLFKMRVYQFLLLSFVLKAVGIFLLVSGLRYFV